MNKEELKKAYDALQARKKKIKRRALFFAGLLLCINTYAWFVFIANANMDVGANVVSWDIDFFEEGATQMDVHIQIPDLYPGMPKYQKKIIVTNDSEVKAKFTYAVKNLTVFNQGLLVDSDTDAIELSLKEEFPFMITFSKTKEDLAPTGDQIEFLIEVSWPFENANPYSKVTEPFFFEKGISYYEKVGDVYTLQTGVTEENFETYKASGIYVESDDADRFWGEEGSIFQKNHPDFSCLQFDLDLSVNQSNA